MLSSSWRRFWCFRSHSATLCRAEVVPVGMSSASGTHSQHTVAQIEAVHHHIPHGRSDDHIPEWLTLLPASFQRILL